MVFLFRKPVRRDIFTDLSPRLGLVLLVFRLFCLRVFPSVLSGHLRNKFEMNLGEHLSVLVEDLDGCHSRDVVSLVSSLRKPLPKISAPPWWSVCSQICQAADCRYKSVDDKIFVRAGGGLEQFLAEDLPILPHDAILSALGCKLPLASLLALQRT